MWNSGSRLTTQLPSITVCRGHTLLMVLIAVGFHTIITPILDGIFWVVGISHILKRLLSILELQELSVWVVQLLSTKQFLEQQFLQLQTCQRCLTSLLLRYICHGLLMGTADQRSRAMTSVTERLLPQTVLFTLGQFLLNSSRA